MTLNDCAVLLNFVTYVQQRLCCDAKQVSDSKAHTSSKKTLSVVSLYTVHSYQKKFVENEGPLFVPVSHKNKLQKGMTIVISNVLNV